MEIIFWPFTVILLITTLLLGIPIVYILPLELFGYRPIGWIEVILGCLWLVISIPLYYVFGFIGLLVLFIRKRWLQPKSHPHILISLGVTVLVILAYFYFIGRCLWPVLDKHLHLHNWPSDLELTSFKVCTQEREANFFHGVTGEGLIEFQLINRSSTPLEEAVFTVKTGRSFVDNGFRFILRNLKAGEKRPIKK